VPASPFPTAPTKRARQPETAELGRKVQVAPQQRSKSQRDRRPVVVGVPAAAERSRAAKALEADVPGLVKAATTCVQHWL